MIFTTKSLIYTCATAVIGFIFYYIFAKLIGWEKVGWFFVLLFAVIGFAIGTFKIPETNSWEITRKLGGEDIDKAFLRWLKFKKKGKVIYTYAGFESEENINVEGEKNDG